MSKVEDGGPAFPYIEPCEVGIAIKGMSLRDWFAGQALAGLDAACVDMEDWPNAESITRQAYLQANNMILAREEK